jgi:hypothetical protein
MLDTARVVRLLFAVCVAAVAFTGFACTKSRERTTSSEKAVAANVAPACVCGQYSPLFCESLTKLCATDSSDPDCDDLDVACVCAPPDERGACAK